MARSDEPRQLPLFVTWCCSLRVNIIYAFQSLQDEGESDEDEVMADSSQSQDSDVPVASRRGKKPAIKKRAGQMVSSLNVNASRAKRLKKESDVASYAITDTKSPSNAARRPGASAGSPGNAISTRAPLFSTKIVPPMADLGPSPSAAVLPSRVVPLPEGVLDTGRHTHHGLNWLYKDRVDKDRRRSNDPDYNPRTLYVPRGFLDKQTPAMRQWWEFKSENMDTVLFFKVQYAVALDTFRFFPIWKILSMPALWDAAERAHLNYLDL